MGGRAGVRDDEQLQRVLCRIVTLEHLPSHCAVLKSMRVCSTTSRPFVLSLQRAVAVTKKLAAEEAISAKPILLSGAGSAWYDVVAEVFSAAGFRRYVGYCSAPWLLSHSRRWRLSRERRQRSYKRNPIARQMRSGLLPALADMGICAVDAGETEGDHRHGQAGCRLRRGSSGSRAALQAGRDTA